MTDLDDRVRILLETRARDIAFDPSMPERVAVRSRRRRAAVATGLALAAAVTLVGGAAALRTIVPRSDVGNTPTPSAAPTPSASPTATQTPTPPVLALPDTFVGVRGGDIVVVDVTSGEPVRTLVDRAALGGAGAVDLEVSPDGSAVYYVPAETPELIMRVPTDGGEPSLIADGRRPTISPDGQRLAYVECHGPAGCGNAIVILDLGTGDTTRWDVRTDRWVGSLGWWSDGRTLAYSMFYPGDSNPTTHLLDTGEDAGAALDDVAKLGPERAGAGWTVVGYHEPTGGLAVLHYCCSTSAADELEETALLSVSEDGRVIATLIDRADWSDVEVDATGRHVLLVDLGQDVYRIDAAGELILVAAGFEHADW